MLHGLCFGEEPEHDTVCFLFKVSAGGEERYLVCGAGAAGVVSCANCSSYLFCNDWWFLCVYFYAVLEAVVADRIGMAA